MLFGEPVKPGPFWPLLLPAPPVTDSNEAGPDMATPRHGLAGIAVAGSVFAMGRARKRGGEQTSPVV